VASARKRGVGSDGVPNRSGCEGRARRGAAREFRGRVGGCHRARRSGQALAGPLHGPSHAGGAQERRAARGGDRALPGSGSASVVASFRCAVALVGCEGAREGFGADAALHYRQGADRGLDHRRHELPEERQAFGGRDSIRASSATRTTAGSRSRSRLRTRVPACRSPTGSTAEGLGRRSGSPEEGRRAGRGDLHDEARDALDHQTPAGAAQYSSRSRGCPRRFWSLV
jgi:hypothetical protein